MEEVFKCPKCGEIDDLLVQRDYYAVCATCEFEGIISRTVVLDDETFRKIIETFPASIRESIKALSSGKRKKLQRKIAHTMGMIVEGEDFTTYDITDD